MASMTEFNLADTIAILSRTPATLNALLRGLPKAWVRGNEGNDSWNAFDIMGHLIVGEQTDWMPRVRIMMESGETRLFDPFDRFAQKKNRDSLWKSCWTISIAFEKQIWLRLRDSIYSRKILIGGGRIQHWEW